MNYTNIKIQPTNNNNFKILEDIHFLDIKVQKGYITNGANIPRIFWSIYPPFKPKYLPAVIIHDWLCDKKQYKKADLYFKLAMDEIKIKNITKIIFYNAVKIYHKLLLKY